MTQQNGDGGMRVVDGGTGEILPPLTADNIYAKAPTFSVKVVRALAQAKEAMGPLIKNAKNPHFKNDYANLEQVLEVVQGPLAEAGLLIYQDATGCYDQGHYLAIVRSFLIHVESGEYIEASLPLPVAKNDPQGVGSAITYGRRYLLMAQCGLVPEDDDGNAAAGHGRQPQRQPQPGPQVGLASKEQIAELTSLAKKKYGAEAASKVRGLCQWVSNQKASDPAKLTSGQIQRLIDGLKEKLAEGTAATQNEAGEAEKAAADGDWQTPADAHQWAFSEGYVWSLKMAQAIWKQMVADHFGGKLTPDKLEDAFELYVKLIQLGDEEDGEAD